MMALRTRHVAVTALVCVTSVAGVPAASADQLDDGQWWRTAMGVDELAAAGGTGKGITVAVIDGPINPNVPELKGRISSTTTECLTPEGQKQSATATNADASHATSMAALIVGSGKGTAAGGRGISGIAPEATLRHYAALYADPTNPGGDLVCTLNPDGGDVGDEAVANAVERAAKDGAKVISVSLSSDYNPKFASALLAAYKAGAIVVGSVNNATRRIGWPGGGNGVVTVNPVERDGDLPSFAASGSSLVDFAAPGEQIATGEMESGRWRSDVILGGSSQATALTAGGLAAIWSAHPDATANQVLQAARQGVGFRKENGKYLTWFRRVGNPPLMDRTKSYGFGIFSPADAIKLDVESLPDENPMVDMDNSAAEPSGEQIVAAVTGAASSTPAPTSSASPSPPATDGEASDASNRSAGEDGGSMGWVAAAVVAGLALVGGVVLWLRRRSAPGAPTATATSTSHNDTARHDHSGAAEGAATTTKEQTHG